MSHEATAPPRRHVSVRVTAGAVIVLLVALLGFAIAVQVHANSGTDSLENLRTDDLLGILDNQDQRADRLRTEIAQLQNTLDQLRSSGDRSSAARRQAREETQALGVLLGTLPAHGPGVVVTIGDPNHHLAAEDLLDVIEELRGAGAEAIQFGNRRVSTDTAFTNVNGSVAVDGAVQVAPYTVTAIGGPKTLDTALNIPGGVAAAIRTAGATMSVAERQHVAITVTRALPPMTDVSPTGH